MAGRGHGADGGGVLKGLFVLGTRGSALALAQTSLVEAALREAHPKLEIHVETFTTSGDRRGDGRTADPAGVKGLFTKELEDALLAGRIDAAVHSLKDLPGKLPERLGVRAVLERAPTEDVLIAKAGNPLRIGTGSVRRRMQLTGFSLADIRGNVPTRLRKLRDSAEIDAIVLARAGLERLGFSVEEGTLAFEGTLFRAEILKEMLPAIGQGAIALEARNDDVMAVKTLGAINHFPTWQCIRAEREFLRLLDGDCDLPVGARTELDGAALSMEAVVFEGGTARRGRLEGGADNPEAVAGDLFRMLYAH